MHLCACTRPCTHMHARARAHTQTNKQYLLLSRGLRNWGIRGWFSKDVDGISLQSGIDMSLSFPPSSLHRICDLVFLDRSGSLIRPVGGYEALLHKRLRSSQVKGLPTKIRAFQSEFWSSQLDLKLQKSQIRHVGDFQIYVSANKNIFKLGVEIFF
jgi:hypothetical protein